MHGTLVLLIAIVSFTLAPPGIATTAAGLRGTVVIQLSPVCIEGRECLEPAPGITLVFHRDGRAVARTTSRTAGVFGVRLPVGRYGVTVANRPRLRVAPSVVRVVRGVVRRVDFEIDRGLQ